MIRFGSEICRDINAATSREWLETNGLGGFASSTIIGLNTRRYHALLTSATKPPVGRVVLLSKLEETLVINGDRYDLSANQYPGVIYPRGFEFLECFRLDPFPIFTYRIGDTTLEKSLFMVQGENTTVVQYKFSGMIAGAQLELKPLIAFRDFHATTHENNAINRAVEFTTGLASIAPYIGLPKLFLAHNGISAEPAGDWYRNFEYEEERYRGLDFREDLFHPLTFTFDLHQNATAVVIASTEAHRADEALSREERERIRRQKLVAASPVKSDFAESLIAAADQFIVSRGELKTIIAGYHWFSDWGRDTMIALPGLTLVTGKHDIARQILLAFAKYVDRGMLPNVFPNRGERPDYNTVDATLWYFEAIRQYGELTGDLDTIRNDLYPVLTDIIDWNVRGTRYGIRVDEDGLLQAGEPGVQLTWMDAKIGDWVVTPRTGKPVEIQALWYNALLTLASFAEWFGEKDRSAIYRSMAAKTRSNFLPQFWNPAAQCLFDVVDGGHKDPAIRPNQIFAASLPFALVDGDHARQIVDKVRRELLTPFGLRTLSQYDTNYRGQYGGDQRSRDAAYHQGTVWPWLLGAFVTAYLRTYGRNSETLREVSGWLEPLQQHLSEAGLGSISEIFAGDPPHPPCGCIAQAWSVAELIRIVVNELQGIPCEAEK